MAFVVLFFFFAKRFQETKIIVFQSAVKDATFACYDVEPILYPCFSLYFNQRNFNERKFCEFQANSQKFISRNMELNPTRESLSTRNFQILPFMKAYLKKNFSNFIAKVLFQTLQSEPSVILKNS